MGKSAARRAEIIDALNRCIARQGYLNTSVRDIATEADIRPGLIHYYFESKEEILERLMEEIVARYRQRFQDMIQQHSCESPRNKLRLGVEFLFVTLPRERDVNRVFQDLRSLAHHDERLRAPLKRSYRAYRKEVARFVSECLEELREEYEDVDGLAALLVAASEGVGLLQLLDPRDTPLPRVANVAYQLVESIMGADGKTGRSAIRARAS